MSTLSKSAAFAGVFVGLFVGSASAQETVKAKVPFPFVVRGEAFPAGRYEIRYNDADVVSIRGTDNKSAIFAITIPADGRDPLGDQPSLVFTRYENVYRLSQIWEGSAEGRALGGMNAGPRIGRTLEPSDKLMYVPATN